MDAPAQVELQASKRRFCVLSLSVKEVKDTQNEQAVWRGVSADAGF